MSDTWGSVRQALGYMFSCTRGPELRQPRYTDAPGSTGHHHLDHVLVAALLYGPNPGRHDPTTGEWCEGCGVEHGDDLDAELQEWALASNRDDESPSDRVLDVLAQLRELLDHHGLRARPACPEPERFYRHVHPDGTRSGLRMR